LLFLFYLCDCFIALGGRFVEFLGGV
jgi:hypothetical protein